MQEAIEMPPDLSGQKSQNHGGKTSKNKEKAYTAGSGDKKPYGGSRPLCSKCNYHHDGLCSKELYNANKLLSHRSLCRDTGTLPERKSKAEEQTKATCNQNLGNDRAPAGDVELGSFDAIPDGLVVKVPTSMLCREIVRIP
ncbi:hypothetical protein Tco_0793246 [Tanacetum coccineum]